MEKITDNKIWFLIALATNHNEEYLSEYCCNYTNQLKTSRVVKGPP